MTIEAPSPDNAAKDRSGAGRKILCIEDERFIGELYQRALTKAGYEVQVESDGQKGLEAAETNRFDIILLDLMIPSLAGIDVLKQLRGPDKQIKAKIIIATNLEQREEIKNAIEKQADGYIIKADVTPRELVEFLKSVK